jgi:uncharacterized protein
MKIWLDQVRQEPFSWDESIDITAAELDRPDLLAIGPIRWQGEVVFADPGFLLRGRLAYDQTLACIRCLKPHVAGATAEVDLLVVVQAHPAHSAHPATSPASQRAKRGEPAALAADTDRELEEDDLSLLVVADEVFDTRALIVEQLQLNVPMKPLCRPDCPGLCPRCGADLGELPGGRCSCSPPESDPRWAALAALKGQLDSD